MLTLLEDEGYGTRQALSGVNGGGGYKTAETGTKKQKA